MDIHTFIKQISIQSSKHRAMNVKQMKNFLGRVKLTNSLYIMLLRHDALNCNWLENSQDYNVGYSTPLPKEIKNFNAVCLREAAYSM